MSEQAPEPVEGDRGPAQARRLVSVNSRVQQGLAVAVLGLVGGGFLFWYYAGLEARGEQATAAAQQVAAQQVKSEMKLPPLVKPTPEPVETADPSEAEAFEEPAAWEWEAGEAAPAYEPAVMYAAPPVDVSDPVIARKTSSPVLWRPGQVGAAGGLEMPGAGTGAGSELAGRLVPTATPAVAAAVMPARRFVLPKGAFIDCTLETAIDSTLPGMTRCVTAVDLYGADGEVVLLERGTTLVGETGTAVRAGQRRVFVLWNEARTPTGVVASLASPGADALGRAGVTGEVDTHFGERFGAAILLSVLDAVTVALVNAQQQSDSTVVLSPTGSSEVVAEVVKETVDVPPTIRVAQGTRIQVFVARDVDFSGVYALRTRAAG